MLDSSSDDLGSDDEDEEESEEESDEEEKPKSGAKRPFSGPQNAFAVKKMDQSIMQCADASSRMHRPSLD